jgi:hypothetical protein
MMNLIKSPHEILMEQANLPGYAEGHSVSPEQMKVELMINGRPVHTEHVAHDHPLIQHFAEGSSVANPTLWGMTKSVPINLANSIPTPVKKYGTKGLFGVAMGANVPENLANNNYIDALTGSLNTAGALSAPKAASKLFPAAGVIDAGKNFYEGNNLKGASSLIGAGAMALAPEFTLPIMAAQMAIENPEETLGLFSKGLNIGEDEQIKKQHAREDALRKQELLRFVSANK